MRPFEIIIPFLLIIYFIWKRPRPMWNRLLPALTVLLIPVHFTTEGYRWQMIPLYVLSCIVGIGAWIKRKSAADPKPLGSILSLALLAVSTALPVLLPVPLIPAPDGPYQVGTTIYELADASRQELYSGKDEARRFQIQVWYPAEPSESELRAPWMNHVEVFAPSISTYIGLPSFFLDHLALVQIPAYKDSKAAISDVGFPVILFSHGWNGFNAQSSGQAMQLASHGYVVVGVQHTYGALVTVFEDGTLALNNPDALPRDAPDEIYDPAADKLADQWAGDLKFALDFLTAANSESTSPFLHVLDLSNVGVYGHSTGGGAAIQFCSRDARCKALFGMDPFMRPVSTDVLERGISQPAFFLFSQRWADDVDSLNNAQFRPFYETSKSTLGAVYIEGTAHYDFSDLPLLSPLAPQLGLKGPINGKLVTVIINYYLLSFFDLTLKEVPSDLFDSTSRKYDEVELVE
jgi:predicted dienelactone hydrolase